MIRLLYVTLLQSGFNIKLFAKAIKGIRPFLRDRKTLLHQLKAAGTHEWPLGHALPCLADRFDTGGMISGHYFHQDLLVAQLIHAQQPGTLLDVGSRVDGFVAHVASFRAIDVVDIRPLESKVPNIRFQQANFMQPLASNMVGAYDAVTCLHAIEHFGLGRYGDPVDINGHLKGLSALKDALKIGGTLYLSTPISAQQRIEFNGQRVFSLPYLMRQLAPFFTLDALHCVNDAGDLLINQHLNPAQFEHSFGYTFGCAIMVLTKKA